MRIFSLLCLTLAFTLVSFAVNAGIIGQWYTTDKGAIVEIYQCGDKLCGKIVWLKEPNTEEGKPKTDINNPDPKKHNDPIIGMNMLKGFVADGDDEWEDGEIYDPKSGKTYSAKMELDGETLEVRGFVGISLFGRTEKWTRVKK